MPLAGGAPARLNRGQVVVTDKAFPVVAHLRTCVRRYPLLAIWLVALALFMRMLVPAGFMAADGGDGLLVKLCAENGARTVVLTGDGQIRDADAEPSGPAGDSPCVFAGHGAPLISGAPPALLALAIAFILLSSRRSVRIARSLLPFDLRPPAIGPPVAA